MKNEYLYMSAEGTAEDSQTRAFALVNQKALVADAKATSVAQMSAKLKELAERFGQSE